MNPSDQVEVETKTVCMPAGYEVTYHHRVSGGSTSPTLLAALPLAIKWCDVVHLTATYSFPSIPTLALSRVLRRPVIWSLRGAIQATEEWDGSPNKKMKRAFERTAAAIAPRFTILHTTADSEAAATARRMPGFPLAKIANSVEIPLSFERRKHTSVQTRLMFLSRVHEKKGLSLLLNAMSQLPDEIVLDIYGTGEETYLRQLRSEIIEAALGERVIFRGHVDGAKKTEAFTQADIFVLPSFSENFGIVVAEALAHGVPVITTDRTPWSALNEKGCGLCIPPQASALKNAIAQLATGDLVSMGARGRAWMARDFSPSTTHASMYELYEAAIEAQRTRRSIESEHLV